MTPIDTDETYKLHSYAGSTSRAAINTKTPKVSEIVADHFRRQILCNEIKEGDNLPPERLLMASLNISRPTLREAFRILESEGFISIAQGSRTGAKVHKPKVGQLTRYAAYVLQSQNTTIADIFEAQKVIEPYIVRRLAQNADETVISTLKEKIKRLSELADDFCFVDFFIGVAEFHHLLVKVSGNNTMSFLNDILLNLVARHQVDVYRRRGLSESSQRKRAYIGIRSYEKLIRLIEAKDIEGTEAHWFAHLSNAHTTWVSPEDADKIIDATGS